MTTALIIGVTGQDGAYLAKLLLEKGYTVHGTSRDAETAQSERLSRLAIKDRVELHSLAPQELESVLGAIERVGPDEIYNLSGPSSVSLSFLQPAETIESIVRGTLNILEAMRLIAPESRFYNAGSSEIFGDIIERPATEDTAHRPKSPYGIAKSAAAFLVRNYRESYGLFACSGFLFNHESPLRPERFFSRKVTAAAVRIAQGSRERLQLGNVSGKRDWGWAPDYVEAMRLMLQRDTAQEFVIATGHAHSLEDFVAAAFAEVDLDWGDHVDFDAGLVRPSDIECSVGDASRAAEVLGWRAQTIFPNVVKMMIHAEQEQNKRRA